MHYKEFEDEIKNLIERFEDIDYEEYIENWHPKATLNQPEVPYVTIYAHPYSITGMELGIFILEEQKIYALHNELAADGLRGA
jgi:hypothetical protein